MNEQHFPAGEFTGRENALMKPENALEVHCEDGRTPILYEIRQRNIGEGHFYCRKRMGPEKCAVYGKIFDHFQSVNLVFLDPEAFHGLLFHIRDV